MNRFFRYQLRTTDVPAARDFYRSILEEKDVSVVSLPDTARARGAVPHWLGFLGVEALEPAVDAFVARGAVRLGPSFTQRDRGEAQILRDPGGAVLALSARPEPPERGDVVWHLLHTTDRAAAERNYTELFGWRLGERVDLGALGLYRQLSWDAAGPPSASVVDIGAMPGVHPHWQFHFRVSSVELAASRVQAGGGVVLKETRLPDGDLVAVCDDPQGAAFGLRELAR